MEVIEENRQYSLKTDIKTKKVHEEKKTKPKRDFDSPWKQVLNVFFEDFMALCWPELHSKIDWSKGFIMLDQELIKIAKKARIKNKVADKLVRVFLKSGEELEILIHIEIQGKKESHFEERMFIYYYRIFDRHRIPIASLAILIDSNPQWRPGVFRQNFFGTSIEMRFPILKISDFLDKKTELEASKNPFAAVILVYWHN